MSEHISILEAFGRKRLAVVGDFLMDQYIIGHTARISREAPIAVVDYEETVNHPGGAANAAQNIAALEGRVMAFGAVGEDGEADQLLDLLAERGVDTAGMVRDASVATSVKWRIMAGDLNAQKQQVARVDRTHRLATNSPVVAKIAQRLGEVLDGVDAILLSDYGLGTLPGELSSMAIELGRSGGVPVVVDSRFNLMSYRGAAVATPNEVEALDALNIKKGSEPDPQRLGEKLMAETGIDGFVVTRGSKGMYVCDASGVKATIDIVGSNEATDVTGAGDTVAAVVALSLACGARLDEAARMANFAASVVVMKRGTATVSPDELRATIRAHS